MSEIHQLAKTIRGLQGSKRQDAIANLVDFVRLPELRGEVLESLVRLCKGGVLLPDELVPHVRIVLDVWRELYEQVKTFQEDPVKVAWMTEDPYRQIRAQMEWLLDFMGYLPGANVSSALRTCLNLSDPLLTLFAALSLLRRLEPVESSDLESIAANHQTRQKLWKQLKESGMESLMPTKWSAPELLAASEFAIWASHPMELGASPEEIELMKTFQVEVDGEKADGYLFRFREFPKPWEQSEGWMAGIAGPYRDGEPLLSPWSAFDDWNSLSPEEHFTKLFAGSNR